MFSNNRQEILNNIAERTERIINEELNEIKVDNLEEDSSKHEEVMNKINETSKSLDELLASF